MAEDVYEDDWYDDPQFLPTPKTSAEVRAFMKAQTGPTDVFRDLEDESALKGLSFNVERLWFHKFPENLIRSWVCGTHIESETVPLFDIKSYGSVTQHADLAGSEIDRIVQSGKAFQYPVNLIPPHERYVVPDLCIAPGHMITKKERLRYVTDWSNDDAALNQSCFPVETNYASILDLVHVVRPNIYMFGLDLIDCFSHWLLLPSQRRLFGFEHPTVPTTGVFTFLPQGFAPSPGINDRNVKALIAETILRFPDVRILDFVDDLRGVLHSDLALSQAATDSAMTAIVDLWTDIGVRLHGKSKPGKYIAACQDLEWIGYTVNSKHMFIEIRNDKRLEILDLLDEIILSIISDQTILALYLAGVIGVLRWAAFLITDGPIFLKQSNDRLCESGAPKLWQIKPRPKSLPNPKIPNPRSFLNEMQWWRRVLQARPQTKIHHTDGVSFISTTTDLQYAHENGADITKIFKTMRIDACKIGWGLTCEGKQHQGRWTQSKDLGTISKSSNSKELTTLLEWLYALDVLDDRSYNDTFITVKTDNMVSKHYLNFGLGNCPKLSSIGSHIKQKTAIRNIHIVAEHLAGASNLEADALSRFTDLVVPLDLNPHKFITNQYWNSITSRLDPKPTFEIFANEDKTNNRLLSLFSDSFSVFESKAELWENHTTWWNPPATLLYSTLKFLHQKLKINKEARPHFYILVEVKNSRHSYFISKFKTRITFRSGLFLFADGTIDNQTVLPKTVNKYVVLSSH
ncbi:MAG: hypothetical protein CME32_02610 [Gimesia sp.]|nr:hypothetical protein [Gimesia sp.]